MICSALKPEFSPCEIGNGISELLGESRVTESVDHRVPHGPPVRYIKLPSYDRVHVKDAITVGGVDVPRVLITSSPEYLPEEFNLAVELLAKHNDQLETRFRDIIRKQQAEYWKSIITVFGIFVAILALVLTSVLKVEKMPSGNFWDSFLFNLAQILPLGLVLLVLVWAVRSKV